MNALSLRKHGTVIIPIVEPALSFRRRLLGLLGRKALGPAHALYLKPCRAVHTCFMRFRLDLVFLDRDGKIIRIARSVPPWRLVNGGREARSVLELQAGCLPEDALSVGDAVELTAASDS